MHSLVEKYKKPLVISYTIFLVLGALFVRSVLKTDDVKIEKKTPEKPAVEIKPVKVTLQINSAGVFTEYNVRLENVDTVLDLLEDLRSNQGFKYEKTAYVYGTELDSINGVAAAPSHKWRVFLDDVDITYEIADKNLEDGKIYLLKLTRIEGLQ